MSSRRASLSKTTVVGTLGAILCSPAFADNSFTLDNVAMPTPSGLLTIGHVTVEGMNLTKDEYAHVYDANISGADRTALVKKVIANKMTFTDMSASFNTGELQGQVLIHDGVEIGVNQGKIASATLDGISGKFGQATFTVQPVTTKDVDFSKLQYLDGNKVQGQLSYASQTTAGGEGTVTPQAQPPIAFKIGPVEATQSADGSQTKSHVKIDGIVVTPAAGSDFATNLKALGYDKIEGSLVVDGRVDPIAKTMIFDRYAFNWTGAGTLAMSGELDDYDPVRLQQQAAANPGVPPDFAFSNLSLRFENAGIFDKVLAYTAAKQHSTPDQLKTTMIGSLQIVPVILASAPGSDKLVPAITAFINNPKNLTVSVKSKNGTLRASDFARAQNPQELISKIAFDAAANQ